MVWLLVNRPLCLAVLMERQDVFRYTCRCKTLVLLTRSEEELIVIFERDEQKAHSRTAAVGLVCRLLYWYAVVGLIVFDVVVSRTLSGPGGNQLNPTQKQSSRAGLLMKTLFCWCFLYWCRLSNKGRVLSFVLRLLLHLFYYLVTMLNKHSYFQYPDANPLNSVILLHTST